MRPQPAICGRAAVFGPLLALALVSLLVPAVAAAAPTPPSADPFYAPPSPLGSYAPGTVLRSRQVTLQESSNTASSTAYQLLYRTTDAKGHPIATVTTLLLPSNPAPGARVLLAYQTAEDSLTMNCAPSYTMRGGNNGGGTQWAESSEVAQALARGWEVEVPDYEGPQSEWAVGPIEGRTTLDSVRAVERYAGSELEGTRTPVAMMGYSGGSVPTLWANMLARSYAPELHLVGAATGGNVPNPIENLNQVNGSVFAGTIIGVSVAVDRAYPELDLGALLNSSGRALAAQDGRDANGCAGSVTNAPFGTVGQYTNYATPEALEAVPRVKQVYAKLDMIGGPVPEAPSYVYNAINDELAIVPPVDQMVASDCARGAVIDYYRDPVGEHLTGAGQYVVPALNFLTDRFAGKSAPSTCAPPKPGSPASAAHRRRPARIVGPKRLRIRHGAVTLKLSCPRPDAGCTGTVMLRTTGGPRHRMTLGTARFTISGGRTGAVTVHLRRGALQRLGRGATVMVRAIVSTSHATTSRRLVLTLRR
jgi:hypothetical protein